MSLCHDTSQCFQEHLRANIKMRMWNGKDEQEQECIIYVKVDRKSLPLDHSLSPSGKPHDAKLRSSRIRMDFPIHPSHS